VGCRRRQPGGRGGVAAVGGLELPQQLLEPAVRGREDQLAEERRLCYVAMTRARRRLVLSWAERYEGGRPWRPSRFLSELGQDVLERDLGGEVVPEAAPEPGAAAAPVPADPGPGPRPAFRARSG